MKQRTERLSTSSHMGQESKPGVMEHDCFPNCVISARSKYKCITLADTGTGSIITSHSAEQSQLIRNSLCTHWIPHRRWLKDCARGVICVAKCDQ